MISFFYLLFFFIHLSIFLQDLLNIINLFTRISELSTISLTKMLIHAQIYRNTAASGSGRHSADPAQEDTQEVNLLAPPGGGDQDDVISNTGSETSRTKKSKVTRKS